MFEIDKKELGAFIAQLRKEKGFTQKELAEKLFYESIHIVHHLLPKTTERKEQRIPCTQH